MKFSSVKTILTIGYQGSMLSRLLGILQEANVTHLIDVRRHNTFHKSPFRKGSLEAELPKVGIQYKSIYALAPSAELRRDVKEASQALLNDLKREMGLMGLAPKANRREWSKRKRKVEKQLFEELFKGRYIKELNSRNWVSVMEKISEEAERPCLLCYERFQDLKICHRKIIGDMLRERYSSQIRVIHLREDLYRKGEVYDLRERFEKLNREYFSGSLLLAKVDLTWHRIRPAWGKIRLGIFRWRPPTIEIHTKLDSGVVPVEFLDHVLHHELVHYQRFRDGLACGHIYDFYLDEQRFEEYGKAFRFERGDILKRLLLEEQ